MQVSLTLGERLSIQWLLISAEGYDLDGARHQKRVMTGLDLNKIGNKSLADLEDGESRHAAFELEHADLVWLRDQIKKRFDAKAFSPVTAGYGAAALDAVEIALVQES